MRQVVIYLTRSTSELVHQTAFEIPGTRQEFEVIRLWEQPTQPFLEATGLLPLAVLTQTSDAAQTLRRIGEVTPERRSQIQALSLPQLEALGEALLDFTKSDDLDEWMRSRSVADSKSHS
jgi:predicted transposase YdaD